MTLNSLMSKYKYEGVIDDDELKEYRNRHYKAFETKQDEEFFVHIMNECMKLYKKEKRRNVR